MMHEITSTLTNYLTEYGAVSLFFLLAVGIVGLPIPDETLMLMAGFFISQGKLPLLQTYIMAFCGSVLGISLSYILGRTVGYYLVAHYGKYFGITAPRLQKAHYWFERIGKWSLFFGYFIPGVRHVTGYLAGATKLHYHEFAMFAYLGALCWVITFLTLGYFFGAQWQAILQVIDRDLLIIVLAVSVVGLLYFVTHKK